MKIEKITVSAGRTFNHPYEQFSNFRHAVTVTATLAEGEDLAAAVKALHAQAEGLEEDHKQTVLDSLRTLHHLAATEGRMRSLEQEIARAQADLERLREAADLAAAGGPPQPLLPLRTRFRADEGYGEDN